jgi:hypothetical protein
MAAEEGHLTAERRDRPEDTRSPAEIHRDLQKTRADLDATVDALGRKLKPQRLFWEARRRVEPEAREAGRRVAHGARDNKKTLATAAGVLAGAWLLRKLAKRRGRRKAGFPPEQQGV